jgi:superoxide dismutase
MGAAERAVAIASLNDLDRCKKMLSDACRDAAASGGDWVFLVSTRAGQAFEVLRYRPGTSPTTSHLVPLLCINMQYHARYCDNEEDSHENIQKYIDNSLKAINWNVVDRNWILCSRPEN